MKLLKVNPITPEKEKIEKAVKIIKNGGLVITPTDTLYALSASASDRESIEKVYRVKGRDYKKPLSIMFYSLAHAKKYVKFNSSALRLAKKFLPGAITLILQMKKKFPRVLTGGKDMVGVRIPDNNVALELIKTCKVPLTATSANISGGRNPITAREAIKQIGKKVDLVLDAGKCNYREPSTVVDCTKKIRILREGAISKEDVLDPAG